MADLAASSTRTPLNTLNAETVRKVYRPIRQGDIRIVNLFAGSNRDDDPIRCVLFATPHDEAPPYTAVSYVWGSQEDSVLIFLNEEPYYITRNLYEVLYSVRRPDLSCTLWIDALCINQLDIAERNVQVPAMARVYGHAHVTLAWLGMGDHIMDNLFRALQYIDWHPATRELDIIPSEQFPACGIHEGHLLAITEAPYWKRVWVVQELYFSRSIVFMHGDYVASFRVFRSLVIALEKTWKLGRGFEKMPNNTFVVRSHVLRTLRPLLNMERNVAFIDLSTWLYYYSRDRECSDPRDIVFGFYNCLHPITKRYISMDYSITVAGVFIQITLTFMRMYGNVDILNLIDCFGREHDFARSLPSWVPNYAGRYERGVEPFLRLSDERLGEPSIPPAFFNITNRGRVLHVLGCPIGACKRVSQSFHSEGASLIERYSAFEGSVEVLEFILQCRDELQVNSCGPYGLQRFAQAACRQHGDQAAVLRSFLSSARSLPRMADRRMKDLRERHGDDLVIWHMVFQGRPMFSFVDILRLDDESEVGSEGNSEAGVSMTERDDGDATHQDEATRNSIDFGIGIAGMREGDLIYTICGCSMPVILRRHGAGHVFVGSAHVVRSLNGIHLQSMLPRTKMQVFDDIYLQ